ncbi:MAG: hypothetical protein H6728_11965 [Myxococcales bacterium]|nr:hypothetical protein [Myxococcales bacterium]
MAKQRDRLRCFCRHESKTPSCVLFLLLAFLSLPSVVWGANKVEKACRAMFSMGEFLEAADCYDGLFQRVDKEPSWAKRRMLLKERFLRHGSLCYRKAAGKVATKEEADFLRERAAALLLRTFREGYCESSFRCRTNRQQAEALKKEIGYTPLVVVTGSKEAKVSVKGYKYQGDATGDFNQPLRPGHYQIRVQGVAGKVQSKKIELKRGVMVTLNVTPAQIQIIEKRILVAKTIPPVVVVGYTIGGGLALSGAILLVVGLVWQNQLNALISDPLRNESLLDKDFHEDYNRAETLSIVGASVGGVGVALLIASLILHFAKDTPAGPVKKPAKTSFRQRVILLGVETL